VQRQKFGAGWRVVFELLGWIPGVAGEVPWLRCLSRAHKTAKYGLPFFMSFR